jgi:hypothetical protein
MLLVKPKQDISLDKTIVPDSGLEHRYLGQNLKSEQARKRWRVLYYVIRSVHIIRNRQASVIQDIDSLLRDVKNSPTLPSYVKKRSMSFMREAIDEHKLIDKLFYHITRSTEEDMLKIERIIEDHHSRYTRPRGDPENLANKQNWLGIRPIYEAARNGHSGVSYR